MDVGSKHCISNKHCGYIVDGGQLRNKDKVAVVEQIGLWAKNNKNNTQMSLFRAADCYADCL